MTHDLAIDLRAQELPLLGIECGLPQRSAYDLVLRPSLDLCRDKKTLAMGSTSGRVWIGEDGGENWAEIDACLPPVYCLRWCNGIA